MDFYFTRMDLFFRKVSTLHILNIPFEYLECKFLAAAAQRNVRKVAIVFYRRREKKHTQGLMTIVCYISQWKRMSLSAVRNAGAEKTRCETRGCAVFIFLHASRYLFPAVQRDVGRLNPLLVPRNSKTRLPRNTEVCERRSFLGCFCEKSSFSVIRASVNVGHRFCKSRRRDIG